jgi:Zn-dependent peptidase ImmA (M78 family)
MNKQKPAEMAANHLLKKHGIETLPVDVRALAQAENVRVVTQELEPEISGVLFVQDGGAVIGVNKEHHPRRQRFTIAHELGHYVLHWQKSQKDSPTVFVDGALTFYRDNRSTDGSQDQEIQANSFAAELLMPRRKVQELVCAQRYDLHDEAIVRQLAGIFGVSEQAITVRLMSLKLLEV